MRLPRLLGGLTRRFGCLWGSYALANLADGMVLVGLPLIAVQLTRSPVLVAGTMVALTLPWFLFGLFAGALADLLDRRKLMIYANVPRVVVLAVLGLAAWGNLLNIPLLYAGAFVLGTTEALFDTSGQALVPMLVDRARFRQANGRLFGTRVVMNEFVGAPLAGALVAFAVSVALFTPGLLYLLAPIALFLVRGQYKPRRDGRSTIRADVREGLVGLWRNRTVRMLAVFAGVANLADDAFMSVFVLFAVGAGSALGLAESFYGVLLTATAVGATAGALTLGRLERYLGTKVLLVASSVGLAAGLAIPGALPYLFTVAGALFVTGFSGATLSVVSISLRQELIPESMLGRVSASFRMIAFGTRPLGGLLGGGLTAAIGLRPMFLVCAGAILLVVPLIVRTAVPERQVES